MMCGAASNSFPRAPIHAHGSPTNANVGLSSTSPPHLDVLHSHVLARASAQHLQWTKGHKTAAAVDRRPAKRRAHLPRSSRKMAAKRRQCAGAGQGLAQPGPRRTSPERSEVCARCSPGMAAPCWIRGQRPPPPHPAPHCKHRVKNNNDINWHSGGTWHQLALEYRARALPGGLARQAVAH